MSYRRLTRSDNSVIAGVCAGLAEYLDIDPTVVRVVYAVLTLFTAFSGVLVYLVLWLVIPRRTSW